MNEEKFNQRRRGEKESSTTAAHVNGVSDEEAVQALLAETNTLRVEQEQKSLHSKRLSSTESYHSSKRKRWGCGFKTNGEDCKSDYYGPGVLSEKPSPKSNLDEKDINKEESLPVEKKKPDFGLSGALAKDQSSTGGSNMYKGVLLKFQEPPEARSPNTLWRFYVFKGEEQIDTLHVSKQSAYLFGRNTEIADIPLLHPSCSSQHAVLQFRALPHKETGKLICQPYLLDLEATNGSFINGVRIDAARYYQLKKGDVLRFGASTREFVLMTANTKSLE